MVAGVAAAGTLFAALGGGRPGQAEAGAFASAFQGTMLGAAAVALVGALVSAVRPTPAGSARG
jgi:hypothetical protein